MMLRQIAHARKRRTMPNRRAEDRAFRRGRTHNRGHDLHQRRLSRTIGTQQTEDFAVTHAHFNALQRMHAACVHLGDIHEINGEWACFVALRSQLHRGQGSHPNEGVGSSL